MMLGLCHCLFASVPEDSNCQYLLDKQIAHYFPSWEVAFDSSKNGFRTSQGCLDLLNWYIDLELRYEAYLSKILGVRYENHYLGDYGEHISNHYFQPFFQIKESQRLLLSITTHYYKGNDEIGIGYFLGRDYINYIECFLLVEDFDRNFSLQNTPDGPDKIIYKDLKYPVKFQGKFVKNWQGGRLTIMAKLGTRYRLESTDIPFSYAEEGIKRKFYTRVWQDMGRLRIGWICDLKYQNRSTITGDALFKERGIEIVTEPMVGYHLNEKLFPLLYLTYNYKDFDDTIPYWRRGFAYLVDLEFHPGGNFVWHLGTQREFVYNSRNEDIRHRRINIGLEYRYRNIWFYLVEAMEGDFPTEKYMHNHTYVQLMFRF
ncbi:MAG: hypothetical protein ABIL70_01990 [candidate division WOR-3 bacterium]